MQTNPTTLYVLPATSVAPLLMPAVVPTNGITLKEPLNVKAFCGEEIRRFTVTGSILTWDGFQQDIASVFHIEPHQLLVKYEDEDGDRITLSSDTELQHMFRFLSREGSPSLIRVFVEKRLDAPAPLNTSFHASSFGGPAWPPMSNPFEQAPPIPGTFSSPGIPMTEAPKTVPMPQTSAPMGIAPPPGFEHCAPQPLGLSPKEIKKAWKQQRKESKSPDKERRRAMKCARKQEMRECKARRRAEIHMCREQRRADHWARRHHKEGMCKMKPLHARFVKHVTIEDGTEMSPNTTFIKTWRMRNDGTLPWPADTALYYVSQRAGDQMSSPEKVPLLRVIQAGESIDVAVQLCSPSAPGLYNGFWKLCGTHKGKTRKFGQQIWCKIQVLSLSDDERKKSGMKLPPLVPQMQEEQENPEMKQDETVSMAMLLRQLKEMGFEDTGKNVALIKHYEGNMAQVVDTLSRERSAPHYDFTY